MKEGVFFFCYTRRVCEKEERCGQSDMDEEEEKEAVSCVFRCFTGENQDKEE